MKIAVVGMGYVGLSLACLLAKQYRVIAIDKDPNRVDHINNRTCYLEEEELLNYMSREKLNLEATSDATNGMSEADYVIIATPTDYNPINNQFDTSSVESIISIASSVNPRAHIIIKSTVPIGFCDGCREKYKNKNIMFSPEFLREGFTISDNLYPSRIVVGDKTYVGQNAASLLQSIARKGDIDIILTNNNEAEAIKLFSNTYLAMRVAYFNELDTFAAMRGLNCRDIIEGVCADPRIGSFYNNPSFGYGGYCLPKDTQQLLSSFKRIPQTIIKAVVEANFIRKEFITREIASRRPRKVGIFRLAMKKGSDNWRNSSIKDVLIGLLKHNINTVIYEPNLRMDLFHGCKVQSDIEHFKSECDLIISNRMYEELESVSDKVYTRDLFGRDT
jgi:UDPglucose 6-dehydrogenase